MRTSLFNRKSSRVHLHIKKSQAGSIWSEGLACQLASATPMATAAAAEPSVMLWSLVLATVCYQYCKYNSTGSKYYAWWLWLLHAFCCFH